MEPNPYQSPISPIAGRSVDVGRLSHAIAVLVTAILVSAALVGLAGVFVRELGAAIRPRFGGIGLILCLNPLIFLSAWFRQKDHRALWASAGMTCCLAVISAATLLATGTTAEVKSFSDQLHTSWLWSVVPLLIMSGLLCIAAFYAKTSTTAAGR